MAADLFIKVYPKDQEASAQNSFIRLIKALEAWPSFRGPWLRFTSSKWSPSDENVRLKGPLSSKELVDLAAKHSFGKSSIYHASALFEIAQINIDGKSPDSRTIGIDICAWGPETLRLKYGSIDIEGCAEVYFSPKPFWAIMDENKIEHGREFNSLISSNLEVLKRLFDEIQTATSPRSLRLVVDEGWALPWNSHCTYFDSQEAVLHDLQFMKSVWNGNDRLKMQLKEFDPEKDAFAFSLLRTPEQRQELWQMLDNLLRNAAGLTVASVQKAVQFTDLKVENRNGGFTIFAADFLLNSFVQNFYLAVLDKSL